LIIPSQRATSKSVKQVQAEYTSIINLFNEEKMEPYLVVVVLNPTKKEEEDGKAPTVLVEPKCVLAKDQGQAVAKALKFVPKEYDNCDSRLEVRVLRFS